MIHKIVFTSDNVDFLNKINELSDQIITKCDQCGEVLWPPRIVCPKCLSDQLTWVNLGDEGELFAFTEIQAGAPLGFVQDVPFCVGIVKVGKLLISARIDDAKYEDLRIEEKVKLKIVELTDGRVFFRFRRIHKSCLSTKFWKRMIK